MYDTHIANYFVPSRLTPCCILSCTPQTNSLQVVMATDGQASFVFFIYRNITWGIANIGFNAGDGVRFFMVPGALTSQTRSIENGSNVNILGLYIYRVDQNTVFEPGEKLNNAFVMATSMHPFMRVW